MATASSGSLNPRSGKPNLHFYEYGKQSNKSVRKHDRHSKSLKKRYGRGHPLARYRRAAILQLPTPMTMPNSPILSLVAPPECDGAPAMVLMERTTSGNAINPDKNFVPSHKHTFIHTDRTAAEEVRSYFRGFRPLLLQRRENELRQLVRSKELIHNDDLWRIIDLADAIFFRHHLKGRVQWEWSAPSQERYRDELIGLTALRPAVNKDGYETLIVLSEPILKNSGYDRRLLLSAFLHELVHCYLFIQCGFNARENDGHTIGFHEIVGIIDEWVGDGYLNLCNMKANLEHFRSPSVLPPIGFRQTRPTFYESEHSHRGCNRSPQRLWGRPDERDRPSWGS